MDNIDFGKVKDLAKAEKGCQIMDELYGKPIEQQRQAFKQIDSSSSTPKTSLNNSIYVGNGEVDMSITAKAPSDWVYHNIVEEHVDFYIGAKTYSCSEKDGSEVITKYKTERF